jgi:hypothetical protein
MLYWSCGRPPARQFSFGQIEHPYRTYPVPLPYMAFFTALLYVACSVGLLIVYSVLYFFVELLT